MKTRLSACTAAVVGAIVISADCYATEANRIRYRLDSAQKQVVELSNLAGEGMCLPDELTGRVAQRAFDKSGLVVQSFVVEYDDGSRELINVDTPQLASLSMADRGWVIRGLQTMLKEGRTVSLKAQRCGAAGRVLVLDAITLSAP